jgi:integrase
MIESYLNSQRLRLSDRTLERRAWSFGLLLEVLADRPLEATTPEDVEAVLARLRAPESRKCVRSDLNQLFRFHVRRGRLTGNPVDLVDGITVPKRMPTPLSDDHVRLALAGARAEVRLMLMLGLFAGLRVSEIAAVRGEDVVGNVLVVRQGKGAKDDVVPLAPELVDELARWPARGKLFRTSSGKAVSCRIARHFKRLGIPHRPHDLRHTFGTKVAVRSNGNAYVVKALMRHSTIATSERYVKMAAAAVAVVVAILKN